MWALAASSQFESNKIETKKIMDRNKQLELKNKLLVEENKKLAEEITFYKRISEHTNALVGNMFVKYIDGKKVWVDRQNITRNTELLHQLDKDNDVMDWIDSKNVKFNDRDW